LEQERDALKGLLMALGHEPLRFEDFTAQPVPSRQACLEGVRAADAYLLLLGAHYGDPLPETGLSPTAEEHVAALTKGIPRLAFVKRGVEMESTQVAFRQEVESYATGLFRASFTDASDLLPAVAAAVQEVDSRPGPLVWSPLGELVEVDWRKSWRALQLGYADGAVLEVHAVPLGTRDRSARELREMTVQLAGRLRTLGAVPSTAAIEAGADVHGAWALPSMPPTPGMWNEARPEALLGVRVARNGQRSAWLRLPADGLGSLLDEADLAERIGRALRLLGGLLPPESDRYAVALGLASSGMVSRGSFATLGQRSSAQPISLQQTEVRVPPDEAVTASGLAEGANEVGSSLSRSLLSALPQR